ncbi:MAG TPA: methyltransferase domain-containing protein [Acidimicrobiales bacterium]|nr:methyltransferase domain-containing protein [Acidimicrobiales bacterium]
MTENPCSLQPRQLTARIEDWRLLAPAILGREQTAAGARLRFRVDPGLADRVVELVHLVDAERQCCPALTFNLELTLDVHAPEELRGWVADTFVLNVERAGHGAEEPQARLTENDSSALRAERATAGGDPEGIEEAVRRHYAAVAEGGSCCTSTRACGSAGELAVIGAGGYPDAEVEGLPGPALAASAGCANPVAVAELAPGETVLDLGSGGGIDVLLSARRVGPTGKAYGLDMTDEMLALAERNKAAAGADNVELLRGRIEAIQR